MPQNDRAGSGSPSQGTRNTLSEKMADAFDAQQTQQNAAFAQTMDEIEKEAKSAHAVRQVDVEASLLHITVKYDTEDERRRAQWRHAEQEMRDMSSARDNQRSEFAEQQERTRRSIAADAVQEYTANAKRNAAQLEEQAGETLKELNARVAVLIARPSSQFDAHSAHDMRPGIHRPSRVLRRAERQWGSMLFSKRKLPVLLKEEDIFAEAVIERTTVVEGNAPSRANSESPSVTEHRRSTNSRKTTSFASMLADMQDLFEHVKAARAQQYILMQRGIDELDAGFPRYFTALQSKLDRYLIKFVESTLNLEAEETVLLAVGRALTTFQAAEECHNTLYRKYADSVHFGAEEVIGRIARALESVELRLIDHGLFKKSAVSVTEPTVTYIREEGLVRRLGEEKKRLLGHHEQRAPYVPEVSGRSILEMPIRMFGRAPRPILSDNATLDRQWALFKAAQANRAAKFEHSQAERLRDAKDQEQKRQVQFAEAKSRLSLEAVGFENQRSSAFQRALSGVRKEWRAREVSRAKTFESTIKKIGGIFLETQAEREAKVEQSMKDMIESAGASIERAMYLFRAMLETVSEEGFVVVEW